MEEIWKDIIGYEGLYQVSNLGRIKALIKFNKTSKLYSSIGYYRKEKILKLESCKNGYLRVALYKNKIKKRFLVHRLVAQAFIINSYNKPQVNHKDGNKTNNNINNLEWTTSKENNIHAHKTGLNKGSYGMVGKKGKLNKKIKIIEQYNLDNELIKKWYGFNEIQRELNIPIANIWACCNGKRKKAKGYIWRYKEEI